MGVSSSLLAVPLLSLLLWLNLCGSGWMLLAVDDRLSLFVNDENTLSLLALLLVEASESARAKTGLVPSGGGSAIYALSLSSFDYLYPMLLARCLPATFALSLLHDFSHQLGLGAKRTDAV
jgi:hypothetical protein